MILPIRYASIIGSVLGNLRFAAGLTQAAVAERSGVASSMISNYERGSVVPGIDSAQSILDAVGWQLCALPAQIADTHDEREAVITAARRWAHEALPAPDESAPFALLTVVRELLAAEERSRPVAPDRNPVEIFTGLRLTVREQQDELVKLRRQLAAVRRAAHDEATA